MLRLAACSYEGSLFGWKINLSGGDSDEKAQEIALDYAFHASPQSLKAIAISASGKYLATAGANERISIYNLVDNRELGELGGHAGGITNLQFFGDSVLISASEDSNLLIWRVHDWENIHILGGHKATIDAFAIHPSGKLAMSTDRDNQLKIWNLVQGRCSYTRKVLPRVDFIAWHPLGNSYALCSMNMLKLFAADSNSESFSYTSRSRINHVAFFQTSSSSVEEEEGLYFLAFICDNQTMTVMDLKGTIVSTIHFQSLHGAGRLKSICSTWIPDQGISLLSIVTSSGCLLLLDGSAITLDNTDTTSTAAYEQWQAEHPLPKSTTSPATAATEDNVVARALIGWHQLPSEPRLTALSAVYVPDTTTPAVIAAPASTTSNSKKVKAQKSAAAFSDIELHVDEDTMEEQEAEDDEDEVDVSKKNKDVEKKKSKKNKRKKQSQDSIEAPSPAPASNNDNHKAKKVKFQKQK